MGKIAVSFMRLMTFMETRVQFYRPSTSTSNTSAHLKVACSHLQEDNLKTILRLRRLSDSV